MAKRAAGKTQGSGHRHSLKVWVAMGSDSDLPVMEEAVKVLGELGIGCEVDVTSAHRTPDETARLARTAEERGIGAIIVGAGHAAHLGGVVAAHTTLPVIGVPLPSSALQGMDALLSTVQMPGGVPVACMAIGKSGATNAGIFAAQILATGDPDLRRRLREYKARMAEKVREKNRALKSGERAPKG
ncbi:MAG TPA: 5-(carboxyamino)imidazole ribonucleotide mutase [Candidatus Polarisedimenticolia bacterium]|nr:5-(carboxyamino)imidazole ribonucleotide mutase [Candidatus Polarisedimenticolia bacterium]